MYTLVTGAGGFIGGHLTRELSKTRDVIAVDIKSINQWYQSQSALLNLSGRDLRHEISFTDIDEYEINEVYNLAADMGGMGFIENNKAACMESVLINTNLLRYFKWQRPRYFYASSACIYPDYLQTATEALALKEEDAYPAMPEDGYGWEKLFSERMCRHFMEDYGIPVRISRYHNVYGPHGTYDGGREKAPAAICRKVIEAQLTGNKDIVIWGDGEQTRSFMYIDDCIKGTLMLMNSDISEPLNIGSAELVSINELVSIVEDIAKIKLNRTYDLNAPKGVRGRNSDNTLIKKLFDWEPSISLRDGLEETYNWIKAEMTK